MRTYPKIRRFNDVFSEESVGYRDLEYLFSSGPTTLLYLSEKIDGANMRFMITEDTIIFGTHKHIINETEPPKQFVRAMKYIQEKVNALNVEERYSLRNYVFFGEGCWKHTLTYNWDIMPLFLGFDIWDIQQEDWLFWPDVKYLYEGLDLPIVPIIGVKTIAQLQTAGPMTDNDIPDSQYRNGKAEGIVIKNYETGVFAKHRTQKFHDAHQQGSFDTSPKSVLLPENIHGTDWFTAKFCTNDRIENRIYALINEGEKLGYHLMQWLPNHVLEDIQEEELPAIWKSNKQYFIDMKEFKTQINKRCKAVLTNMIELNTYLLSDTEHSEDNTQ